MNPYPFSLSSFCSQFLISVIFVYFFLVLVSYLVLSIRSRYFVAIPARLADEGNHSRGRKFVYKYVVGGKEYSCRCGSSLLSLSGAALLFGKKEGHRSRCGSRAVIYCDPAITSVSCHDKEVKSYVVAFLSALSISFFVLLVFL
jgi:hypothetical protein